MTNAPIIQADAFFSYARERYRIHLHKEQGLARPWTEDRILQTYRFCNIFREDDRTTRWFRENIREPLRANPMVVFATVAFRWFNKVELWQCLLEEGWPQSGIRGLLSDWNSREIRDFLYHNYSGPITSGAYIIKTPDGMNKLDGVLWCIDQVAPACGGLSQRLLWEDIRATHSLRHSTELLTVFPFMGPFMAYEVVTDLRHTYLLEHAQDIHTWANPGPGAARGASRLYGKEPGHYSRGTREGRDKIHEAMTMLLGLSRKPEWWPEEWPQWEMREVEHTLCEFDKYERARSGYGRPKQRYDGKGE